MADESATKKVHLEDVRRHSENGQNPMTKDEIDQLSEMISDCMGSATLADDEDTGSFKKSTEEDTGEFKPIQD